VKYETLCPTWDESVIFDDVVVYGLRDELIRNPPVVTVEIYDYDIVVSHSIDAFSVRRPCASVTAAGDFISRRHLALFEFELLKVAFKFVRSI